ncbi:MAG: peptidoglycan-associated lipoprotein Pal [Proteobacteria bacterium]|nr:peptidoglycan-associated lipoprotein Pal [Pseudomonadota bacterium]
MRPLVLFKVVSIKRTVALLPTALVLALALTVSGCSSKSKGDKDGALSESELNAARDSRFGEGNIPRAEGEGLFRDVFFAYDSAQVTPEGRADIEYNAKVLQDQSLLRIVVEGHCDERGTAEYNMALGNQRARAVQQVLISLGVASNRVETVSYGEEVPLDPGHDESAWAKNRRVHLSPYSDAGKR